MTNPTTIDRRDVAHATNPLGGQPHVEQIEKANFGSRKASKAGGSHGAVPVEPPAPEDTNPARLDEIRAKGHAAR